MEDEELSPSPPPPPPTMGQTTEAAATAAERGTPPSSSWRPPHTEPPPYNTTTRDEADMKCESVPGGAEAASSTSASSVANKLPNPLPPGMPPPPISTTSVVEPSSTDQMYMCPLCHENQPTQKDFTTHIRGHNEVKPHSDPNDPTGQSKVYYCCLCGKMLSSFSSLDRHMLVHSGERPFSCELCGQTFTTNGNMHRHKRTHGNRDSHGNGNAASGAAGGIGVDGNGVGGGGRGRVGRKRKQPPSSSAMPGVDQPQSNKKNSLKANVNLEDMQQYSCLICPEAFRSELNLDHHMYESHHGQEVTCHQCNFPCPNYNYLKLHRTMFHFNTTSAASNSTSVTSTFNSPTPSTFSPALAKAMIGGGGEKSNNIIGNKPTSAFSPSSRPSSTSRSGDVDSPPPIIVMPPTRHHPSMPLQLPSQVLSAAAAAAAAEAAAVAVAASAKNNINIEDDDDDEISVDDEDKNNACHDQESNTGEDGSMTHQNNVGGGNANDLADVQSMLSMVKSGSVHKLDESDAGENSTTDQEKSMTGHEGVCLIEDPIIRDMKLKGEFPCRLCPAVYPNLRALKGHNKEHLGKPPYVCNVGACTYSSNDKSTLTRHMRTHTGEKPFECKLCNYGFTTKANCERHLKNKHGKTSRDAIKTSIIVHESEDGGQHPDALNANNASAAASKLTSDDLEQQPKLQYRCKVCKQIFTSSDRVIAHAYNDHPAYSNDVDHIFEEIKIRPGNNSLAKMLMETDGSPSMVPRPMTMIDQLKTVRPPPKQTITSISETTTSNELHDSEAPLDLSRPSRPGSSSANNITNSNNKKAEKQQQQMSVVSNPSIYNNLPPLKMHGKIPMMAPNLNPSAVAAAAASMPGILPPGFPAYMLSNPAAAAAATSVATSVDNATNTAAAVQAAASQLNSQLRPGGAGFPLLFPFLPFMNFSLESLPPELREQMKQKLAQTAAASAAVIQQPQLGGVSGGGASNNSADDLTSFMQQEYLRKQTELKEQKEAAEALQHLSKVQNSTTVAAAVQSRAPPPSLISSEKALIANSTASEADTSRGNLQNGSDSDSNYKMIIKNGVLMKKQKQRRYRTERPYSCNHCEARFTLRSNMERHIKQQHPQYWCQKPRGSRRNHTATVPVLAPQFRNHQDGGGGLIMAGDDRHAGDDGEMMEDQDRSTSQLSIDHPGDHLKNKDRMQNQAGDSIEDYEEEEEGFEVLSDNGEDGSLIIDEPSTSSPNGNNAGVGANQDSHDLASVTKLLNTATNQSFQKYFDPEDDEADGAGCSSGSNNTTSPVENNHHNRKKSAYSAAPHKIACPYCERKFPWTSSLRRHILTHTGQKPFKCPECNLWFTTKSNCDRHLVRKHGGGNHHHNNNNGDHNSISGASSNHNNHNSAVTSSAAVSVSSNAHTMRNVPDRPFKCKMCPSSTFSSQSNLRKHHLTKHLDMEYTGEDNEDEGDDEFSMEEEEAGVQDGAAGNQADPSPFRCHICSIGFEVRALALTHMRGSHPEECDSIEASVNSNLGAQIAKNTTTSTTTTPLQLNGSSSLPKENAGSCSRVECIFCPFVCKTFFELRKHVSKDHGVKYTCDICQKSFSLKKLLLRHKKKHDSGVSSDGDESDNDQQHSNSTSTNQHKSASSSTGGSALGHGHHTLAALGHAASFRNNEQNSPSKKNKPSLMDTINKLSKRNDSAGNSLENLFNKKSEVTANLA